MWFLGVQISFLNVLSTTNWFFVLSLFSSYENAIEVVHNFLFLVYLLFKGFLNRYGYAQNFFFSIDLNRCCFLLYLDLIVMIIKSIHRSNLLFAPQLVIPLIDLLLLCLFITNWFPWAHILPSFVKYLRQILLFFIIFINFGQIHL